MSTRQGRARPIREKWGAPRTSPNLSSFDDLDGIRARIRTAIVVFLGLFSAGLPLLVAAVPPQLDRLESLRPRDGMSHRWVISLHQAPDGFLWIGTSDGLNRYDGQEFKIYRNHPDDPESLLHDFVEDIDSLPNGDLWIHTVAGLSRLNNNDDHFIHYKPDPDDPTSLKTDWIGGIHVDSQGTLWVSHHEGLDRYDPEIDGFEHFLHDPDDPNTLSEGGMPSLLEGSDGILYLVSWQGVLNAVDRDSGQVNRHPLLEPDDERTTRFLAEDDAGWLWAAVSDSSLVRFNPRTGERRGYASPDPTLLAQDVNDLYFAQGFLWLGTQRHGVFLFDPEEEIWHNVRSDPDRPTTLSDDRVMTFLEDRTGVMWIGTDGGLDKFVRSHERFKLYRHHPGDPKTLSSSYVWPVFEDHRGELWVGTNGFGLDRMNLNREVVETYRNEPNDPRSLPSDFPICIFEDSRNRLWIATKTGLAWMNEDRVLQAFDPELSGIEHGITNWIYHIVEDSAGILWLGGVDGLWRLDPETMQLRLFEHDPDKENSIGPASVYGLAQDANGHLWLAMSGSGLTRFDPETETFTHFRHDPENPNSLSTGDLSSIFIDDDGIVWIGSQGNGFDRLDPTTGEFRNFIDGLPSDHVNDILADLDGHLWMSTNGGLSRFDPQTETFRNYDVEDGLQGNVFLLATAHRSRSGELFFAGKNGLTAFYPDRLLEDPMPPKIAITEFLLFNQPARMIDRILPEDRAAYLEGSIPHLTLTHRDSVVGFKFAALHFANPGRNRYAYQLVGVDPDWVQTRATQRFAQYTNLEAGHYVFHVRAAQQDGVWNDEGAKVRLTVLPPWWETWWAYLLYTLLAVSIVAGYIVAQKRKIEREREINEQLRQVDKMKDEFLANTSHELRTPLYGIIGISESMIDGAAGRLPNEAKTNLEVVAASGKRLSKLVEDLLDFSKMNRDRLQLDKRPQDLRAMVDIVLTLSRPLIGSKALSLINAVPAELPAVEADENRLQQVLFNLIGNAIKFTESGSVEVDASLLDDERLEVRVRDTGIGIDTKDHEAIFATFAQVDASTERSYSGTGLGLALTRELVQMHGGSLWVESELGQGSTFIFTLPTSGESALTSGAWKSATEDELRETGQIRIFESSDETQSIVLGQLSIEAKNDLDKARILVVDDEPINRLVLINQLAAAGHRTTEASSGFEALRLMETAHFDLLLLDIMMPRMSGFEVCKRLREIHSIEQLPIIFLTAKNQVEDRVLGFASGANDYLTKPVAKSELLARVETHLSILEINRKLNSTVDQRTEQVKTLSGLLPICGVCKRIRDDHGYWNQLEAYLDQYSDATLTHGICPDCVRSHYAEYVAEIQDS